MLVFGGVLLIYAYRILYQSHVMFANECDVSDGKSFPRNSETPTPWGISRFFVVSKFQKKNP